MQRHLFSFAALFVFACPLMAQVEITDEWFDNKRLTLEITLKNTSDSSIYLTAIHGTCIEYRWHVVYPGPGDGRSINTKSAARYLFDYPENVTSDDDGNRMAKNSTEALRITPLELPKRQQVKIELGYDFLYSDFDNVTYTGFVSLDFQRGAGLRSKTFSFGDERADQEPSLTQSQLIEKINRDTAGNFSYVYHMMEFPWDKREAMALLAKYIDRPEQTSRAIIIEGMNKEEVLATTISGLGLDSLAWYIREKFLAKPSATLLRAADFKKNTGNSKLLEEFLERYVARPDSAQPAYAGFFADFFIKTYYPTNCKQYRTSLQQIFEQYASANASANLNTGALNAIAFALLRANTDVRSRYSQPLSDKIAPWINRTLENSPEAEQEKLLDQILKNIRESRGEPKESSGYLDGIANAIYALISGSGNPGIRAKSLKISNSIPSLAPKMDAIVKIALNDADQKIRTTAAEIVRDQKLAAFAPELLHNMARYDTAEGVWVYWKALEAIGMQNTKEAADLLLQRLDNPKIKSYDEFYYALTKLDSGTIIQPVRSWFLAHTRWASSSKLDTIERLIEVAMTLYKLRDPETIGTLGSLIRQKSNSLFIEKYFSKLSLEYFLYAKTPEAFAYLRQLQPDIYPYYRSKSADLREDVLILMCTANEDRAQVIQILRTGLADNAKVVWESAAYYIGKLGIAELKEDLKRAYQKNKSRDIREALIKLGEKTD